MIRIKLLHSAENHNIQNFQHIRRDSNKFFSLK